MSNEKFCKKGLTAWVSNTNTQLLPSGGDFATCAEMKLWGPVVKEHKIKTDS